MILRTRYSSLNQCSTVNERQRKNKMNRNTYNISSLKRVVRKFLEVSHYSHAKQQQRNVHKKCAAHAKLFFFFANETYWFLWAVFVAVAAQHYMVSYSYILMRASLLALAQSLYYFIYLKRLIWSRLIWTFKKTLKTH